MLITLVYCGAGVFCNFFVLQVFCMPVMYASVMCVAFFATILSLPFLKNGIARMGAYLLLGTGVPICLYCILFLADPYEQFSGYLGFLVGILFFGMGLLAFIPFYLLWHVKKYMVTALRRERLMALAGCVMPLVVLFVYLNSFGSNYENYLRTWDQYMSSDRAELKLPHNYFTERFLGVGFKYHTKVEYVYDGWRPPLHDPFLNIGLWVYSKGHDGFYPPPFGRNNLEVRMRYYHAFFPDKALKVNCPCTYNHDGLSYFRQR